MAGDPGPFAGRDHRQLGVITSSPLSRRVKIDLFWTTKAVHRVVHLDAFPAMIVVVLIKHEIGRAPTRGEETVEALFVWHVHQLIDLPPVVPLKTLAELRIAFQRGILMHKRAIGNSRTT